MLRHLLFALTLSLPAAALAADRPAPKRTQVADGIYLFETAPYGEVGLDGNSVAIVSSTGVLVFDTNGTPAAAAAVLAGIKEITTQPVRYIVNSHWHWDHWYGTQVYKEAFPNAQVVAHAATREMMMGPAIEFNRPGIEQQLPRYVDMLEKKAGADPAVQGQLETAASSWIRNGACGMSSPTSRSRPISTCTSATGSSRYGTPIARSRLATPFSCCRRKRSSCRAICS